MASQQQPPPFVWIDLEMTGLDVSCCSILEIACIITDHQLSVIAEHPSVVIAQPASVLDAMDAWCREHHGRSGLLDRVRAATTTVAEAEQEIFSFIKRYCQPNQSPLCGNSVWMDRLFLQKYMPAIVNFLHYRVVDVSTVKQLVNYWYGEPGKQLFAKKNAHRATDDLLESITELAFYRDHFFRK